MAEFFLCIFKKTDREKTCYVYFIQLKSATHKYALFQSENMTFQPIVKEFQITSRWSKQIETKLVFIWSIQAATTLNFRQTS